MYSKRPHCCLLAFLMLVSLLSAEEKSSMSLEARDWHKGNDSPYLTLQTAEENGAQLLRLVFKAASKQSPEARLNFIPPKNISAYAKVAFQMRVSQDTTNGGWMRLNDEGWKHQWKCWELAHCAPGKRLTANAWQDISATIVGLNKRAVIQFAIGYPVDTLKPGESLTMDIKDLRFTSDNLSEADRQRNQDFDRWLKNYQPDYSDSSCYLQPPQEGRIPNPLPLVRNGKPCAEIIYDKDMEPECVTTAAQELQLWIERITGARLPLRSDPSSPNTTQIHLGKRVRDIAYNPDKFRAELKALSDSDGYAIRTEDRKIYIFGTTGKGTMNGVYAFLMGNTDIIWVRPGCAVNDLEGNDDFTVFSTRKDLDAVWANTLSRPALRSHGFQATATYKWLARNLCNYYQGGGGGDISYRNPGKRKWGNYINQFAFAHNVSALYLNPKVYFKDHPEFYSLVNGKRKPWAQLCFTNKNMQKVYIENVLNFLRRADEDTECIYISLDDTWEACQCPQCTKPILGKSGKTLVYTDENFRSTQYYLFMNDVAKAIRKEFPRVYLRTLAYFSTAPVPDCDVHEAIRPEFAPYVRVNDKRPIFSPENQTWLQRLRGWSRISPHVDVYEYFTLGLGFPRPLPEIKQFDFPVMFPHWSCLSSEYPGRWNKAHEGFLKFLDYGAFECWVLAHQMWDPTRNPEQLRRFCLRRTFREASPHIERFFGLIRTHFLKHPAASTLGDSPVTLTQRHIIDSGLEPKLRQHLANAAKLASHPVSKQLIALLSQRFEDYIQQAKAIKTPHIAVPLVRINTEPLTFDHKAWQGAQLVDGLQIAGTHKPSRQKTQVRIFHDSQKLYVKFTCFDTDMKHLLAIPLGAGKTEQMDLDDHLELFLQDGQKDADYYLFGVNSKNTHADIKNYDGSWKGTWTSQARTLKDAWEVIMTIPFKTINCSIDRNSNLRGTFIREYSPRKDSPREYSSWQGGRHHQIITFGTLKLMK